MLKGLVGLCQVVCTQYDPVILKDKMGRVELPGYFRVIIVLDPITYLAKRVMSGYMLIH